MIFFFKREERGEIFPEWKWTETPRAWLHACINFIRFVGYVGTHPDHMFTSNVSPTNEIDRFMLLFRDSVSTNKLKKYQVPLLFFPIAFR